MAENQNSDSQGTAALPTAPPKRRRPQLINPEDQIEVKLHRCKDCDNSFFTGLELAKHKKLHKTENLFKCPFCEHETAEAEDLITHIQIHNDYRSFCCDQCNYATTDAFKLTRHKRTHTDSCTENLFKCPFCEDETAEAEDLIIHIQIHNDYSSFYCDKCNYASTDAFKLTRHKRTHTGERSFLCSACQITFTKKLTMELHILQKPLGFMSTANTKLASTPILLPHLPQHDSKNNKSSLLENEWSPGPQEEEFAWQVVPAEQEAEVHFLISSWEIDALSQYHILPVQTKDGSIIGLRVTGLQEMEQVDAGTIHTQVVLGKDV